MLTTLTRAQFDSACQTYVVAHSDDDPSGSGIKNSSFGWTWIEHSYIANLGYLSRTVQLPRSRDVMKEDGDLEERMDEEDADDAVCSVLGDLLTCIQYVVYSATFQVPTFYFTLHDTSGSPLSLEQILKSSIFRAKILPSADGNTFALTLPESSIALLSQGDHPTLGIPSWYFHPCNTAEIVGEIVAELDDRRDDPLRWIEAWFMVMGNIVDFLAGHRG